MSKYQVSPSPRGEGRRWLVIEGFDVGEGEYYPLRFPIDKVSMLLTAINKVTLTGVPVILDTDAETITEVP